MLRAAIFDLDGTLADSLVDIRIAANRVLADFGQPQYGLDKFSELVGDGVRVLFERALQPSDTGKPSNSVLAKCIEQFDRYYAQQWRENTCLYAGIEELLRSLLDRNVAISVLSNKPDHFTKEIVHHLLHEVCIDPVLGKRVGIPLKPDPHGVDEIRQILGLTKSEIVFVGDTNTDMSTGKNAGVFTVGVTWGFRTRHELESAGADRLIDQPRQLLEMFG